MSPRQISSVTSGRSGADTRVSTSSVVYSVSNAACVAAESPEPVSQKRSRDRRMYQLVITSTNWRTDSQAPGMS